MSSDQIRLPDQSRKGHRAVLHREIPALQLLAKGNGHARWGPMIRLPKGAELEEFGRGFDDQTRIVKMADMFYIVFAEDLAAAETSTKQAKRVHTA